jgi:hypothetical protein
MNNINCFKVLENFPKIPHEFVSRAMGLASTRPMGLEITNGKKFPRIVTKNGNTYASLVHTRFLMNEEMGPWVSENISEEWDQIGVNVAAVDNTHTDDKISFGTEATPHTDGTRDYALMYLISQSNFDQDLVFWQERGFPIFRKRNTIPSKLDQLNEVGRVRIPLNTWVYFNTNVLHSVENILESRIAIHIGFNCEPMGIFEKE